LERLFDVGCLDQTAGANRDSKIDSLQGCYFVVVAVVVAAVAAAVVVEPVVPLLAVALVVAAMELKDSLPESAAEILHMDYETGYLKRDAVELELEVELVDLLVVQRGSQSS
jgi:uncharacterized membrane protein